VCSKYFTGEDDPPPDEILRKAAQLMRTTSDLLTVPDGYEEITLQDYTCDVFRDLLENMAEDVLTVRMAIQRCACQSEEDEA